MENGGPEDFSIARNQKDGNVPQKNENSDTINNYDTKLASLDGEDSSTHPNVKSVISNDLEELQPNVKNLSAQLANCNTEKMFLFFNYTFPKRLKIKYVSPSKMDPTELPSTGKWGSFSGKTSTTDRIARFGEINQDCLFTKINQKFIGPTIQKVEIFDGNGQIQTPKTYYDATENWYFLVTLKDDPIPKGGRTRKRHHKRSRMRSHKKRKTRTRGTKRRLSQTKR